MSGDSHIHPGESAPRDGLYQEHNVFGTPTGRRVAIRIGESLPSAPMGFTWTHIGHHTNDQPEPE